MHQVKKLSEYMRLTSPGAKQRVHCLTEIIYDDKKWMLIPFKRQKYTNKSNDNLISLRVSRKLN